MPLPGSRNQCAQPPVEVWRGGPRLVPVIVERDDLPIDECPAGGPVLFVLGAEVVRQGARLGHVERIFPRGEAQVLRLLAVQPFQALSTHTRPTALEELHAFVVATPVGTEEDQAPRSTA